MSDRSPFHDAIARAIEEGGVITHRTRFQPEPEIQDCDYVTEMVGFKFEDPKAAKRALELVKEQLEQSQ